MNNIETIDQAKENDITVEVIQVEMITDSPKEEKSKAKSKSNLSIVKRNPFEKLIEDSIIICDEIITKEVLPLNPGTQRR
jgi:hypothetical protein